MLKVNPWVTILRDGPLGSEKDEALKNGISALTRDGRERLFLPCENTARSQLPYPEDVLHIDSALSEPPN